MQMKSAEKLETRDKTSEKLIKSLKKQVKSSEKHMKSIE